MTARSLGLFMVFVKVLPTLTLAGSLAKETVGSIGIRIVYVAVATGLLFIPLFTAIAFIVVVDKTGIALVYSLLLVDGSVPSVVK